MAFVKEKIPEEYWGMLKELGLYNEYTYLDVWVADKDRGIYMWTTRLADREDRTSDSVLIWQNAVVYINTITVAFVEEPVWVDDSHPHLQRGLVKERINKISIPQSLASQGKALIEVIREAFHHSGSHYDIELTHIATPEVREEK
ncbi:hypothetical protein [Streptococcus dentiloxodontae]